MLIGAVSQVALNHVGLLVVDEIQHVVNHKNGKSLVSCLTQLINNTGISICMIGTPESATFFTQAYQLARRSLGLRYDVMKYGEEFQKLCQTLFQFQYVRQRSELDAAMIQWLYEHSGGNVSTVVALIHDAQEIAIIDGKETLNLDTLKSAYDNRITMLHSYIAPPKKVQTSRAKPNRISIPLVAEKEVETDISIVALVQRAKNECREAATFLQEYITVEEVSI